MRAVTAAAWAITLAACTLAPPPGESAGPGVEPLPPPGYGTLREDEVSVSLASGAVEVRVTPLVPSVLVTTAPDTERRLSALAARHPATEGQVLVLVSFHSSDQGATFVPEELQLIARGRRLRPLDIEPLTPGWGQRRLRQRTPESAVYVFGPDADFEADVVVAYGLVESSAWASILPRVQAERARARARARR